MNVEKRAKIIIDWINNYCDNTSFKPKSLVKRLATSLSKEAPLFLELVIT